MKDNLGETISIIKIDKAILYFDIKKFINFFNLKGEVFNVPFIFDLTNHDNLNKYEIHWRVTTSNNKVAEIKSIEEKNKLISGENYISLLNC